MIEEIISIDEKTKKYKCKCDKTGELFGHIKPKDERPSNIEAALCDTEIEKFKKHMGNKAKTDCWCKHLSEYIGGS